MEQSLPANETPRLELLERDVSIQFKEIRRLRSENERLRKLLNDFMKEVMDLGISNRP